VAGERLGEKCEATSDGSTTKLLIRPALQSRHPQHRAATTLMSFDPITGSPIGSSERPGCNRAVRAKLSRRRRCSPHTLSKWKNWKLVESDAEVAPGMQILDVYGQPHLRQLHSQRQSM
jgi:hypothetical protein